MQKERKTKIKGLIEFFFHVHISFYHNIPNWDIMIIPLWDNGCQGGAFMRLKEIRKAKGISQLKLAMDLNTNQNTISRYETGEREPGILELIKIADYFGVSVDYLLERTDNPQIQK